MELFRITSSKYARALKASGRPARWNSKDVEILYFAGSLSLACLENLVHRSSIDIKDNNFRQVKVLTPDYFKKINDDELPVGWNEWNMEAILSCRKVGDAWVFSNTSLLLRVPSVIVPGEYNFLANPKHQDFNKIKIKETRPFMFDGRLK